MKIAVDVDAVLLDLVTPFLDFYNERHKTSFETHMVKHYNFHKSFGGTLESEVALLMEFCTTEAFRNLTPVKGSVAAVKKLHKKHELIIVTSRNPGLKKLTEYQLNKYFPNCFDKIIFTNEHCGPQKGKSKKAIIISKINPDIVIEDCLDYLLDLPKATKGILLNYPWNQNKLPKNVERAMDWKQVLEIIENV
ncbi:MAG: hypothetical protein PHU12_01595 [Candidatus Aenigmarchaeota archaeon]|nr:hypothetical protein [Candidatus Aenigmarchaeota archaeon]